MGYLCWQGSAGGCAGEGSACDLLACLLFERAYDFAAFARTSRQAAEGWEAVRHCLSGLPSNLACVLFLLLLLADNRLKLGEAVRHHISALPARRAATRLLATSALRLAPQLDVRALSGERLLACVGGCNVPDQWAGGRVGEFPDSLPLCPPLAAALFHSGTHPRRLPLQRWPTHLPPWGAHGPPCWRN